MYNKKLDAIRKILNAVNGAEAKKLNAIAAICFAITESMVDYNVNQFFKPEREIPDPPAEPKEDPLVEHARLRTSLREHYKKPE